MLSKKQLIAVAKLLLKLGVSALAFYFVFKKIDTSQMWDQLRATDSFYLFLAFLAFVLSKLFGAFRLNTYYENIGQRLGFKANIKLYWYGLFYNLVLPGGIGGDGYKVYWLQKHFKTGLKKLVWISLLDRASGIVIVFVFCALMLPFITFQHLLFNWTYAAAVLSVIAFYFFQKWFFKAYSANFGWIMFHSFWVQAFQLLSVHFTLLSMGIMDHSIDYWFVFMLGTFAFALPITMGGVGSREVVFVLAAAYLPINAEAGVLLNVIGHLIRGLVSLPGMYFLFDAQRLNKEAAKHNNATETTQDAD